MNGSIDRHRERSEASQIILGHTLALLLRASQ